MRDCAFCPRFLGTVRRTVEEKPESLLKYPENPTRQCRPHLVCVATMLEPSSFLLHRDDEHVAPSSSPVRRAGSAEANSLRSRRRTTPPTDPSSVWNFSFPPRRVLLNQRRRRKQNDSSLTCVRKRPHTTIGVVIVIFFYIVLKKYKPYNGRRMDHFLIYWTMIPFVQQQERALQQRLGFSAFVILRTEPTQFPTQLHVHLLLRTLLLQRHDRSVELQRLEQAADRFCRDDPSAASLFENSTRDRPVSVFVPQLFHDRHHRWDDVSYWVRPTNATTTQLRFESLEMEQLVETVAAQLQFPLLRQIYQRPYTDDVVLQHQERVNIWALCVVYWYGGVFVNGNRYGPHTRMPPHTDWYRDQVQQFLTVKKDAEPRVAIVPSDVSSKPFFLFQFVGSHRPRNPLLQCLLYLYIHSLNGTNMKTPFSSSLPNGTAAQWQRWLDHRDDTRPCLPMEDVKAFCNVMATQGVLNPGFVSIDDLSKLGQEDLGRSGSSLLIQWIFTNSGRSASSSSLDAVQGKVVAEIRERDHESMATTQSLRLPKVWLQSLMQRQLWSIEPNWFCNRCLHWSVFGTYESCAAVCSRKYVEFMCQKNHPLIPNEKHEVTVDVVLRRDGSASSVTHETRIPRIIHQTWYDDVTYDRYPQLARHQASWKTYAGWEYRFYNDDAVRLYIQTHYPIRFLDAYDALIHGAYKADLFRYLVLLREGGVYADIDIMLQGSLDALITSRLSFFVPRDIPCAYADGAYCLWNGLIGSTPGNPIIVRAVERLVNFIEDRADLYDMERETCLRSQSLSDLSVDTFEVWKLRAEPLLVLSGPCGLGMAMNEALHRNPLTSIPLGWMSIDPAPMSGPSDHGDALILLGDKYDLGEFRISHPETGVIIAATDILSDSDKMAVEMDRVFPDRNMTLRQRKTAPQHYSKSKSDNVIWGAANVYKDNLVRSERILLKLNV